MKKRIFAVAAALCLMAGTGAFAQEAKPAAAPQGASDRGTDGACMTERMQRGELKLTKCAGQEVYNLNFQQIRRCRPCARRCGEARKAEAEKR